MKPLAAIFLLVYSLSAFAVAPCAKVLTTITPAQQKMYGRSISSNLIEWQPPDQIKIDKELTMGNWTAVWATPKGMEQGVFFYSREKSGLTYHDVWAGYATPSEKPSIVQWVKKLSPSVPNNFAECFADAVTAGH